VYTKEEDLQAKIVGDKVKRWNINNKDFKD
jgi:hypothetical protein